MRKELACMLAVGMIAGSLAGCGSGGAQTGGSAANTAAGAESAKGAESSGDKLTIEFWHCMGSSNGELIQQITDSFNESQDKIFVKAVHQGSYTDAGTKMQAALAAGRPLCWLRWRSVCWGSSRTRNSWWICRNLWMQKIMISEILCRDFWMPPTTMTRW